VEILETDNLIVNIIEERIFHLIVKDFCSVTYEDAIEATAILTEYCVKNNMDKIGMNLIEFGHGATADQAVREYASTKDANNRSNGSAILVKNFAQQLIGDYYLKFNHPRYPTKVFYKKEKALAWIRKTLASYDNLKK
jgi:hypothetical protein